MPCAPRQCVVMVDTENVVVVFCDRAALLGKCIACSFTGHGEYCVRDFFVYMYL